MIAKTNAIALYGLKGFSVEVEADINQNEQQRIDIVGLPDAAVKEAKDRVKSAIKNSKIPFPFGAITLNLAPADLKKEGSHLDLAIAVAIIKCQNQKLKRNLSSTVFIGELALDGAIRGVSGVLPMTLSSKENGFKRVVLPCDNAKEASLVEDIEIIPVKNLLEVLKFLDGEELPCFPHTNFVASEKPCEYSHDLKYVKGQFMAKRALEVAVSGGHNLLMIGSPGSGKTMLAKCIPSIMPDLSFEEALETTAIHSVSGLLDSSFGVVKARPFYTPHHTATVVSLIGGGQSVKPGIISLAHNGVLYLDEMPEYTRSSLECLRQPLEDAVVTVSRAKGSVKYPADFMLVASMNPCPCGNYGSETLTCKCTDTQIKRYRSKISGPLLDRIDLQIQVDNVKYDDLVSKTEEESSLVVRRRVNKARLIQKERFLGENILLNSQMTEKHLAKYCVLDQECENLMKKSFEALGLSARARARILKVARTIADLEFSDNIKKKHLLEAIGYKSYEFDKN